jgi:hypothetical protein
MQIRSEQMLVFEDAALRKWTEDMVEHAREFAPQHTAAAGEENVRLAVRSVIQRTQQYGFTDRGPCRLFLELVLSFGSGFDTDPLLPWAASTLQLDLDQHRRAARLHAASKEYFLFVHGENDEFAVAALRRALTVTEDSLVSAPESIDARIAKLLQSTYPEKYAYCGPAIIDAFLEASGETASRHGITTGPGRAILTGVLFAFGSQADSDPLYPWIGQALEGSGQERAAKLHDRLKVYLERMIPVLEA